ncbi:MAG: hypothetical protein RR201_03330 [Malacoplasma sp.]
MNKEKNKQLIALINKGIVINYNIKYNKNKYKINAECELMTSKKPKVNLLDEMNKRFDSIEKDIKDMNTKIVSVKKDIKNIKQDIKLIKSLPTIAKELREI